jgi:hypothetical protein
LIPTSSFYAINDSNQIFQAITSTSQHPTVFNSIQTSTVANNLFNSTGTNPNNNNNNIISNTLINDSNGKPATIKAILPQMTTLSSIDNLNKK